MSASPWDSVDESPYISCEPELKEDPEAGNQSWPLKKSLEVEPEALCCPNAPDDPRLELEE